MIFDIGLAEARDIPQGKSRILTQDLLHNSKWFGVLRHCGFPIYVCLQVMIWERQPYENLSVTSRYVQNPDNIVF